MCASMVSNIISFLLYLVSHRVLSYIGPLLFIIYINDITTTISANSDANMFADDIALYRVIRTTNDYDRLQEDIDFVSTCINQKQLQFNVNKCKMII